MRLILPLLLLVALLVVSIAIDPPRPRADLVTGYSSIETLDPQIGRAHEDIEIAYALFEGLVTFDPKDFSMVPGVAASWDISDDGTVYTFHLRPDAKWSNGDPVTAGDFRFAWSLGLTPDTAPPYIDFLYYIKGAKDYYNWAQQSLTEINEMDAPPAEKLAAARQRVERFGEKFDELVGVKVIDDRTLRVELQEYLPYFTEIASTWALFPLHPPTIRAHMHVDPFSYRLRRDPQWTKPENIVCDGPYVLDTWEFKRRIRLRRNEHFHSAKDVNLATIEFVHFQDYVTMFTAYESGELDLVVGATPVPFAPDLIAAQREGKRNDVHELDAYGTYYYVFNTRPTVEGKPNIMADVRLRKALAMTIDKKRLVEDVTRLHQTTTTCLTPIGAINGYDPPQGLPYDPDQGRKLLADAGFPNGQGFPAISLLYNTGGGHEFVAQAIAHMWKEQLNIDVKLEAQEWKVFLRNRNVGQFSVARSGWFGDYSDPTTFVDLMRTGNGNNDAGFSDAKYDAMLDAAAAERDQTKRFKMLSEAEHYGLTVGVPLVPLYYYNIIHLYDPNELTGVTQHQRNVQMYWRIKRIRPE
ncbi:MAG: hypothetical protein GC159_22070 [Phycisphaera sp.]|nr:hypothetical protein [Phycisphaera sp.]